MSIASDSSAQVHTEWPNSWIFQFRPEGTWYRKVVVGQVVDWVASQFRSEMRVGDLAFLWMTTDEGGLHGWGTITAIKDGERAAAVVLEGWIKNPIPRKKILGDGAIQPDNTFVRVSRGTNFRLSHQEAAALSAYFSNQTELLERLRTPRRGRTQKVLGPIERDAFTPAAFDLIHRAATFTVGPSGVGQVTSTRLLLALASSPRVSAREDGGTVEAFGLAVREAKIATAIERLEADYRKESPFTAIEPSTIDFSPNVRQMLSVAAVVSAEVYGVQDKVNADAIAAALFALDGRARGRLERHIPLDSLLDSLLAAFQNRTNAQRFSLAIERARGPASHDREFSFASLGNDDPWSGTLDDRLGVANEARAFARAAAANSFDPPLAFGIFGNWGSGKSFFMRLIHDHVERLRTGTADEAATGEFQRHIVQIRFNAWHYVDQNLWASLVDHIFAEIDLWTRSTAGGVRKSPLLERLVTARELTLEASEQLIQLRKNRIEAEKQLSDASNSLDKARKKALASREASLSALAAAFDESKKKVNEGLPQATHTLGVDRLIESAKGFGSAATELSSEFARARLTWSAMISEMLVPRRLVFFLLIILIGPPVIIASLSWIKEVSPSWLGNVAKAVNDTALQIVTIISAVAVFVRAVSGRVRDALTVVDKFRNDVESAAAKQVSTERTKAEDAASDVARLAAEAEAAKVKLAVISEQLATASLDFKLESGHSRLRKLIQERLGEQGYGQHLGLIARIRKDFAELSAIATGKRSGQEEILAEHTLAFRTRVNTLIDEGGLEPDEADALRATTQQDVATGETFSRIVLYIDDLDRCPPERVVEVLQAVHLLLTFPLFVIFVAVDARWVGRSLEQHYGKLLHDGNEDLPTEKRGAATALDYLEKIFQVAYKVRALDARGSATFLETRAKPKLKTEAEVVIEREGDDKGKGSVIGGADDDSSGIASEEAQNQATPIVSEPMVLLKDRATMVETVVRSIELSEDELIFLSRIARCAGDTPRRALRFLNSYRVIKAGLADKDLRDLAEKKRFRVLMTQLALATSAPAVAKRFNAILDSDGAFEELKEFLNGTAEANTSDGINAAIDAIRILMDEQMPAKSRGKKISDASIRSVIASLRQYGSVAARYSFVP